MTPPPDHRDHLTAARAALRAGLDRKLDRAERTPPVASSKSERPDPIDELADLSSLDLRETRIRAMLRQHRRDRRAARIIRRVRP